VGVFRRPLGAPPAGSPAFTRSSATPHAPPVPTHCPVSCTANTGLTGRSHIRAGGEETGFAAGGEEALASQKSRGNLVARPHWDRTCARLCILANALSRCLKMLCSDFPLAFVANAGYALSVGRVFGRPRTAALTCPCGGEDGVPGAMR
jgi:hypothetical protein